jgi:hypothetical protein
VTSRVTRGPFQLGGKLPFDKLRANEKACPFALSLSKGKFRANEEACPFALSLSKGKFAPNLKYAHNASFAQNL